MYDKIKIKHCKKCNGTGRYSLGVTINAEVEMRDCDVCGKTGHIISGKDLQVIE